MRHLFHYKSNLSAAFDTIVQEIVIARLEQLVGMRGAV